MVLFLFVGTSQPAITFRTRARYPSRGLAGPSHRSPGGVDLRGLIPCPETARQGSSATGPILPAMRRLFVFLVAATLFASCGGQSAAGSDRPVRILAGSPTTLDPAAQGDAGSAADHGPALRVADQLRRRPPGPPGPRRIVAVQCRWTPGDVPSAPGPDVLGRQPAAPVGCDPQLVAPDRSGASVATRLARPGHRRRRRVPAGNGDRPRDRRPPRRRRIRRPGGRPGPAGDRFRQHRRRADVLDRPARSGGGCRGADPGQGLRRERRIHAVRRDGQRPDADRQSTLLGGQTGRDDDRAGRRPRWEGSGRCLRGGRSRLHLGLRHRCHLARLRRGARTAAPPGRLAVDAVLRVRHQQAAVRRRARPAGVRQGHRLAADGRPEQRRRDRAGRELDGAARASPVAATRTSCRSTTRPRPAISWPRPVSRAVPGSRPPS